ncbi:MAG: hypothetical protein K2X47_07420, partial [Bdellovibrionales bacterium]|nr:hypothetical protein [Bdellovibrionales bacterium]
MLNGKVGIGNASPAKPIDVAASANSYSSAFGCPSGWCISQFYAGGVVNALVANETGGFGSIGTATNHDFSITSNNVARISIAASGNVGIGTPSPISNFVVNGGGSPAIQLLQNTATGSAINDGLQLAIDNSRHAYVWNYEPGAMFIGTSDIQRILINSSGSVGIGGNQTFGTFTGSSLYVDTGGNVGIGTTSPASKLHIGSAPTASANYGLLSLGSGPFDGSTAGYFGTGGSSGAGGTMIAGNAATGYTGDLVNLQVAGAMKFKVDKDGKIYGDGSTLSNVSGAISGLTSTRVPFATSSTAIGDDSGLTWDNTTKNLNINGSSSAAGLSVSGRIYAGINDSNPYDLFQANNVNTAGAMSVSVTAGSKVGRLRANGGTIAASGSNKQASLVLQAESGMTGGLSLSAADASGAVRVYSGGSADANERLTILSTGNVGIGTASPQATLHVAGKISVPYDSGGAGNGRIGISDSTGSSQINYLKSNAGLGSWIGTDTNGLEIRTTGASADLAIVPNGTEA